MHCALPFPAEILVERLDGVLFQGKILIVRQGAHPFSDIQLSRMVKKALSRRGATFRGRPKVTEEILNRLSNARHPWNVLTVINRMGDEIVPMLGLNDPLGGERYELNRFVVDHVCNLIHVFTSHFGTLSHAPSYVERGVGEALPATCCRMQEA